MSESVLPEGRFSSGGWVHLMRVHFTTEDRAFPAAPALDQGSRRVLGAARISGDPVARQISAILGQRDEASASLPSTIVATNSC